MLRHLPDFFDHPPRHHSEIPGIQRQTDIGERRHHAVKHEIADAQRQRLFASHPLRVHNVVSLLKSLHKLRDYFRNILQVSVHHNRGIAGHMIQARRDGRLMPEIPR